MWHHIRCRITSSNESKDSYKVAKYLKDNGYKIIPINPTASEILGEQVYSSINDIHEKVDIVNVFRPGEECLEITKQFLRLKPKVIWLQIGIKNEEAKKLAEINRIEFVQDKCIKIEHHKLLG
ncbi:MAG: CoA-binding protein [Candidatus Aenigmarchaeota archaeon]|nr:CoA-binding protein [Candidatus Aenigmarchaeota archaeon]